MCHLSYKCQFCYNNYKVSTKICSFNSHEKIWWHIKKFINKKIEIKSVRFVSNKTLCKSLNKSFAKKCLNVPSIKLFSTSFFNFFSFFIHYFWEWHVALYILSDFLGIRNLSCLNSLSSLNDLYSLISSKNLLSLMFSSTLTPKWPIMVS